MAMSRLGKLGLAGAGIGSLIAVGHNPAGVGAAIADIGAVAKGTALGVSSILNNFGISTSAGTFGALAPFAAPAIGGVIGYKLAGTIGMENKFARGVFGGGLGAIGTTALTVGSGAILGAASPWVLGAGGLYAGYKVAGKAWTWAKGAKGSKTASA